MTTGTTRGLALPERITDHVRQALVRTGSESLRVRIAGSSIGLTVAPGLAPVMFAPFAHLISPESATDVALQIEVAPFDERLELALQLDDAGESGRVISDGDRIVHLHRNAAVTLDRRSGWIHALMRRGGDGASWQRAKPLQLPLSVFFADRGVDLVHGGLVSLSGKGLLIAGAGGSGKSTLTISGVQEGLDFLGDDCVGVRRRESFFEGYSVFGSSCLERSHAQKFALPDLVERANGDAKNVLPIGQWFGKRMASSTQVVAIVLPRVTHAERVSLIPVSKRDALLALAPSSIIKRAVPAAGALAAMARLVRELPAFRLEMGPIAEAGSRLRELLEEGL